MTDILNRDRNRENDPRDTSDAHRTEHPRRGGEAQSRDDVRDERIDPAADGSRPHRASGAGDRTAVGDARMGDRPGTIDSRTDTPAGDSGQGHAALFPADDRDRFRTRWMEIQTNFVDEPRRSVEQADDLVSEVTDRIAALFAQNREDLERQWSAGDEVSTEDLRRALRSYRSFFERLLSV